MKSTVQRVFVSLSFAWLPFSAAQSATTTATFQVTAAVETQCMSVTTNALAFGTYNPASGAHSDAQATFAVRCTSGTPIVVSLNKGTTPNASIAQRLLASATTDTVINYNLYTATERSLVWGETSGTDTRGGTGSGLGTDVSFTVFGRITSGQSNVKPGTYADTVTITVTY